MRIMRIVIPAIAYAVLGIFVVLYLCNLGREAGPEIFCDRETIEASVTATDEELLSYVTATDKEDGDLTKQIVVEKGSYFLSPGVIKVRYAVCDSDNNVATLMRKLIYTDYESPKIFLKSDFIFPRGYNVNFESYVTATDVLDGDITSRLKMISTEFSNLPGTYKINLKVANRQGDLRDITIDAIVTDTNYQGKTIDLSDYIIYTKVGEKPDFSAYLRGLSEELSAYSLRDVVIDDSHFDASTSGVYNVFYTIPGKRADAANVAMTRLVVVSED